MALLWRMTGRADDQCLLMLPSNATDFFDRAWVAEIDRDVAVLYRCFDRVAEVAWRDHVDVRIVSRKIDNRPAHSTARTNQRHAHRVFHFAFSNASSVFRNRVWFASLISQSGKRTSPDIAPRQPSAVLTGTGFGSINKSL